MPTPNDIAKRQTRAYNEKTNPSPKKHEPKPHLTQRPFVALQPLREELKKKQ